ncbi:SWI/SNF and RSC complexes subunit ssr4 [Mycena sanguinolenta]|uniref:SWI/SNF and RSC complexes subunit ssr4 n=1 Tax=Mycena sanguinolenta TaxID=230812 RepID=A0A8H7DFB8_9AGAR|nr:SWI/SNF and RSC complexes subunit ssr4 [Mycena sanguinolenta]
MQQAQADGLCLRFPETLGVHRELTIDNAVMLLLRGTQHATNVPFSWGYIDKPQEGQTLLLFIPGQTSFPTDGIRYQEPENKYVVSVNIQGTPREVEVHEVKFGFIPGADTAAFRQRRRYRITKGGHPQLILVHYSRGPPTQIAPNLMNQPVRSYPLRIYNEPSVYVVGEKAGQKVFPPGAGPHPGGMGNMPMGMGGFNQQQAMAQQNNNMALLERRREQEQRARAAAAGNARPGRVEEDDSGDENDTISTRALSLTRYRRNHDIMNEVFAHAAYGQKNALPPPSPFSIFNKAELEAKTEKLKAEIEALQARSTERKLARSTKNVEMGSYVMAGDISMDGFGDGIPV